MKIKKINPDLDEGTYDERASKAFDVRAAIRGLIENSDGSVNSKALADVAERNFMAKQTVERFAYGNTKKPSNFTLKRMGMEADAVFRANRGQALAAEGEMVLALVPRDTQGIVILE